MCIRLQVKPEPLNLSYTKRQSKAIPSIVTRHSSFVLRPLSFAIRHSFNRHSSIVISVTGGLNRAGAANRHALGMAAAQVAMVDIIIPFNERIKGAGLCQ
jgi:hypothetical protein